MFEEPRWWRWLAVFGLAVGVMVRGMAWLRAPLLPWEDGSVFFAGNYAEFSLASCVKPYAGYVPFGANTFALLLCRLPTPLIPVGFVAAAMLLQVAAAAALLRPAWRALAPFSVRLMCAAVVGLLPLGSHFEFTTLAYAQWPMLWWLFVTLLEPTANPGARPWGRSALVLVLSLSHPLAFTLLPLWLLPAGLRGHRLLWRTAVFAIAAYWVSSTLLVDPVVQPTLTNTWQLVPTMLVRIGLECVVGLAGWQWLEAVGQYLPIIVAIAVWLGFALLLRMVWQRFSPTQRGFVAACFFMMLAPLSASLIARPEIHWHDVWIVRYLWGARVAFCVVATLAVTQLLPRWPSWLLGGVLGVVLMVSNRSMHQHAPHGPALQDFLQAVQRQEERLGERRLVNLSMKRGKQSMIVIRPRSKVPR